MNDRVEDPRFQHRNGFYFERVSFESARLASPDPHNNRGHNRAWHWATPNVFRALAGDLECVTFPGLPEGGQSTDVFSRTSYWAPLHYLLSHRLGWARPGQGLMRWYDDGFPTVDETLRLVDAIWRQDGSLDTYLAWRLRLESQEELAPKYSSRGESAAELSTNGAIDHFVGGWDPMHLTGHLEVGDLPDDSPTLVVVSQVPARAIYTTRSMSSWSTDLTMRIRTLPANPRSWRVEVHVASAGYLGTFRLSKETNRLFAGRHRIHQMGN